MRYTPTLINFKVVCILCILEVKGRGVLALNLFIWLDGKKLTYFDSNFRVYEIYTNANKGFDKARALALNKEGIKFFTVCVFAKSFLGLGAEI